LGGCHETDGSCTSLRSVIGSPHISFDPAEALRTALDGKWGYIDLSGQFAIAAQFAGAFHFADGLASVRLDERTPLWGFIDKTGMVVIKPQFGMPLWFSEGLVEGYGEKDHVLNVPLGYVDKSGKYTVHLDEPGMEIEFLVGFSEGLARVSMRPKHQDGSVGPSTWGYIDHSGSQLNQLPSPARGGSPVVPHAGQGPETPLPISARTAEILHGHCYTWVVLELVHPDSLLSIQIPAG
jgi:WG containing repeat